MAVSRALHASAAHCPRLPSWLHLFCMEGGLQGRSFSNDLSPIVGHGAMQNPKGRGGGQPEEITQGVEQSGSLSEGEWQLHVQGGWAEQEERIASAAKTLVFLFTPNLELIEMPSLERHDAYQKARIVLRELMGAQPTAAICHQVERTSHDILALHRELQDLTFGFEQLEAENRQKDEEIARLKTVILDLSRAYEQAKVCFADEIREQRYEIEELKRLPPAQPPPARRSPRARSKNKVTLQVPLERNRKQSEAFTDRSIYQRFSAALLADQTQIDKSQQEEQHSSAQAAPLSFTHHHQVVETYQYERQKMQRAAEEQRQKITALEQQLKTQKQHNIQEVRELKNKVGLLEAELKLKAQKLKEKNAIIAELLDSLEAGQTH